MPESTETLMSKKEWELYMSTKNEGKDIVWNNYWTKIDDKREYKGEFKKDNKILAKEEAAYKELENCTFQPDTYDSKRHNDDVDQRDLYEFLNDQQRFLEYKSLKSLKSKQE